MIKVFLCFIVYVYIFICVDNICVIVTGFLRFAIFKICYNKERIVDKYRYLRVHP